MATPVSLQLADLGEQRCRLDLRQRRSRLIHQDDLRILTKGTRNLDELLLRNR